MQEHLTIPINQDISSFVTPRETDDSDRYVHLYKEHYINRDYFKALRRHKEPLSAYNTFSHAY